MALTILSIILQIDIFLLRNRTYVGCKRDIPLCCMQQ